MRRSLWVLLGFLGVVALAGAGSLGVDLWKSLSQSQYEVNWHYIPGKPPGFYKGTQPHGFYLRTYVNNIAYDAIQAKAGQYPDGAIIVKENYTPDKTLASITVMKKIAGYDPAGGDWFWAKYNPDGSVAAEGKLQSCASCHARVKGQDYVYSARIK